MKHLIKLTTLLSLTGLLLIMNNSCEPECETCQDPPRASDQTFSVAEESPGGTSVGFIKAESTSGALSYHMVSDIAAHYFVINETTGEITVRDSAILDYEPQQSYTFDAVVTDTKDDGFSVTLTITINITKIDELKKGLVAYYPFNGNANDESVNKNHGELRNDPTLTTDRFGNANSAYEFDGVDDHIVVSADSTINNIWDNSGAISFWVYLDSVNDWDRFFAKDKSDNMGGQYWSIHLHDVGNYLQLEDHFSVYKGEWYTGNYIPNKGEWIHMVVAYDSDTTSNDVIFYINGQKENTIRRRTPSGTRPDDSLRDLFIGGDNSEIYEHFFDGKMDDIRIYNRILSDDEVQTLYSQNGWGK